MTDKFQSAYKILNSQQKQAVDTIEGSVMVVAGPGTGKTQILTLRIANILIQTQVNPENILALTFTESAVAAMRKRLVSLIGTPGYKVEINTFHGFCNDLIKKNPDEFGQFIAANSITEIEQIQIIEKIIIETKLEFLKPLNEQLFYLKAVLGAINELKKEGIDSVTLDQALQQQQEDFEKIEDLYHEKGAHKGLMKGKYQDLQKQIAKNKELLVIYQEYQKQLRTQKVYDFNDMLLEVVTTLQKDKNLLLKLQETYQYILVDEHQDTNAAQNKLVEQLCGYFENPNIFVVGDEKQAIFRFQGASLENFLYFKRLYPNAILIHLEENYRSSQSILNAATSLIKHNIASELLTKVVDLKSQGIHSEEKIQVAALSDYFAEYHFVAQDIQKKINGGHPASEIAVLGRNNRDILPLADVLEQYGIPFVIESDQNIFSDPEIRKLIFILKAIGNFGSDEDLIPVLHIDFLNIDQLDIYKLINYAATKKLSLYELIADVDLLGSVRLTSQQRVEQIFEQLKKWKSASINENIERLFADVLNESGFREWILSKPNVVELLDKVTGLFEEIKQQVDKNPLYNLDNFLDFLELLQTHEVLIKKQVKTILKDAVRLMTAHKSKGLEFDYVYVINVYDGHWGNQRKRAQYIKIPWEYLGVKLNIEVEENEDERRLFYVCLTRARKGISITYSQRGLDGKEQIPSQFIDELVEEHKEVLDVSEFESQFLGHKEVLFSPRIIIQPDLRNKEFFKELFLERGLSVTALNNYIDCPWKYFYRNLLRLPEAKTASAVYGSAVHKALSDYIRSLKSNQSSLEIMMSSFSQALSEQMPAGDLLERYQERGRKSLQAYYDQSASQWEHNLTSEVYIKGVKLSDNVRLTGVIDMIQPIGKGSDVVVYDFKTGNPKSRNKLEAEEDGGDYKRQLQFYKLLLDNYHDGKLNMVEGVIDFVEQDSKGKFHREAFSVNADDVRTLQEHILQVSEEIVNLKFWDQGCNDVNCEYCALRKLMVSHNQVKKERN